MDNLYEELMNEYLDDFLGSEEETKAFLSWFHEKHGSTYLDDESETDLLNAYRDSGSWVDTFLDWAYAQKEAK